ncbi:MAG: RnfABCDGE type electron transport complex subunit D [Treponemataceae bacterium]|nr:RnfABCDGE type electron transport complex subunit D [Treponemataceae bacterium]
MAAPSDKNEIYISSSPHFSKTSSTTKTMLAVICGLLPLAVYGVVLYGVKALVIILTSVVTCVVSELAFQLLNKQPLRILDLSAVVTGLLLALVCPPRTPVWMVVLGAVFAIVVAKQFFGGIGANVFNPALAGRAFMFVSFSGEMGNHWVRPSITCDGATGATMLSKMKAGSVFIPDDWYMGYFLGNRNGCIGESSILLILLAFIVLVAIKVVDWRATVGMVCTVAVATFISGGDVLMSLMAGGLLFGAVFMATDYATTPVTPWGRLIFGIGCGLITFLIRHFGSYPEGVMFSILIMNSVTPFLNKIVGRKYGYAKKSAKKGSAK